MFLCSFFKSLHFFLAMNTKPKQKLKIYLKKWDIITVHIENADWLNSKKQQKLQNSNSKQYELSFDHNCIKMKDL